MREQRLAKPWKAKWKAVGKDLVARYYDISLKSTGQELWSLEEPIWPYL